MKKTPKISIIGLGYVGLPLAIQLAKHFSIVGFDTNGQRVRELQSGHDRTNECDKIMLSSENLIICDNQSMLKDSDIYIITVPTPIKKDKSPDLSPLINASDIVGRVLKKRLRVQNKKSPIVIFESTVYPGATQEICGKEIEKFSGMKMEKDFFLGYSPERINPGDKVHTVEKITKVIASENTKVTKILEEIYSKLTSGNIFVAKNIKVAEASKVIENSQRDINIAFINEITQITDKLGISIFDVLEASKTKWNFLPFYPGLVGGHCIGVDPFYLAEKAKDLGIKPQVILSGRKTNDKMSEFIFNKINPKIKKKSNILILGLSFKENVPDTRNSKVYDLINFFNKKKHNIYVFDPLVNNEDNRDFKIKSFQELKEDFFDVVILAVSHDQFKKIALNKFKKLLKKGGLIADLKGLWRENRCGDYENYWCM